MIAHGYLVLVLGAAVQAWGGPPFVPAPPSIFGRDPALDPTTNAAGIGGGTVIVSYPFVFTPTGETPVGGPGGRDKVSVTPETGGIFVHRSTDADGVSSNGLIAITGRGLILVDTAWTDTQTEAILKWGDEHLNRPWIGAVITHDHPDRAGGLAALERRHIPTAALDLTVTKLAKRGVRNVTVLFPARDGAFKDERGFEAFYPGPESVRRVRDRYGAVAIVPGHGPTDPTGASYQHTLDLLDPRAKP